MAFKPFSDRIAFLSQSCSVLKQREVWHVIELRKTKHELLNQICLSYAGFSLYPYEKSEKHLPGVIFFR